MARARGSTVSKVTISIKTPVLLASQAKAKQLGMNFSEWSNRAMAAELKRKVGLAHRTSRDLQEVS